MKHKHIIKLISLVALLSVFTAAFSFETFATDSDTEFGTTYTVSTKDGNKNLIHNEYYALYYDDIFEAEYESLHNYSLQGMTDTFVKDITEDNEVFATVILKEKTTDESYSQYNRAVLKNTDVIYAGSTTPLSVIKTDGSCIDELLNNDCVAGIFPAFFSAEPIVNFIAGTGLLGDADCSLKVTAADARTVLRYSAGLTDIAKEDAKHFYFQSDMNFDNVVNSADARLILRTAAGFEEETNISLPYAAYWNDFQ